jgi:hypothetical protein
MAYRYGMRFRHSDFLMICAAEVITVGGFCYLTYLAQEEYCPTDPTLDIFRSVSAVPFVVALAWLIRRPSNSQWIAIRGIHQAFAVVTLAIAAIVMVGLPETLLPFLCLAVAGAIHLVALKAMRHIAPELPPMGKWHRVLRVSMVFLFAIGFLSFK